MKEKDIRDAWARIRTIDQTIPDEVLDFMKDSAIEKLKTEEIREAVRKKFASQSLENESSWSC